MRLLPIRDPLFFLGLLLRFLLLAIAIPHTQAIWFTPFLDHAASHWSIDPWTQFTSAGGNTLSFPYGPGMLLALLPLFGVGKILQLLSPAASLISLGIPLGLLIADTAILKLLIKLSGRVREVLLAYWLSPIVLFVTYWHGQLDVIPVAMTFGVFLLIRQSRAKLAGAVMGLAIASKLSMVLVVPFLCIYFWQNKRLNHLLWPFFGMLLCSSLLLQGFALFSPGFRIMALGSPEIGKIYSLSLNFENGPQIYLLPLTYALMLYAAWRLQRTNHQLLLTICGVAFMAFVLMTPASPGWYLWIVPFLALYTAITDRFGKFLVFGFSFAVTLLLIGNATGAVLRFGDYNFAEQAAAFSPHFKSIWLTLCVAIGAVLAVRYYRQGIRNNDYFKLSRQPLTLGIAGDSGVGKDTFAGTLAGLFSPNSVSFISGDDYHRWDRHTPMWQVMTHLNPQANDLLRFTQDALDVIEGKSVKCRPYDHGNGRFGKPTTISGKEVVLVSGLHTLLPAFLAEKFDVRIFIDTSDALRIFWKLRRDVATRATEKAAVLEHIKQRQPDREAYILPQMQKADLVFTLSPARPEWLEQDHPPEDMPLKLRIFLRDALYYDHLFRVLVGICGLAVDMSLTADGRSVELVIEGEVSPEDISLAAHLLVPNLDELLATQPVWHGQHLGIMQLTTLLQISEVLRKRVSL